MKSELDIDLDRLDSEWTRHPSLYYQQAMKLADARRDLEIAKEAVDVVYSELLQKIGKNPEAYGLTKSTDPMVKAAVETQPSYRKARLSMFDAKHVMEIVAAYVDALDAKKYGLQDMVKLQLANYFSTPKADNVSREAVESMKDQARRRKADAARPVRPEWK